jgi:hypothetical protein
MTYCRIGCLKNKTEQIVTNKKGESKFPPNFQLANDLTVNICELMSRYNPENNIIFNKRITILKQGVIVIDEDKILPLTVAFSILLDRLKQEAEQSLGREVTR